MDDIKIPGIVGSIITGCLGGMYTVGALRLWLFSPIESDNWMWELIGGAIGSAYFIYYHFALKKEKRTQDTKVK